MDTITRLLLLSLCGCAGAGAGGPLGRLLQRRRDAFEVYARDFARQYEPYMFAAFPLHAPVPVLRVLSRAPLQPRAAPPAPRPLPHYAEPGLRYPGPTQHYAEPGLQYADPGLRYLGPTRHYADPGLQYPGPTRHYADPGLQYAGSTQRYAAPARPSAADDLADEASSPEQTRDREYERPARPGRPRRPVSPPYEYAAEYASYAPLPQLTYVAPLEQEAAPTVLYARPSPSGGFTYRRVPSAPAPAAPKRAPTPLKEKQKEKDPPYIIKIHKYRIVKDDLI